MFVVEVLFLSAVVELGFLGRRSGQPFFVS